MSENVPAMQLEEPPEIDDPLLGETVDGRYLIESRLGEGGMGVVYKCKHVVLQKDLAMKVLRADVSKDQEIIQRFRQEAQSASSVGSQHIIDISDFGTLKDGSTYFVMEHLDGQELTAAIEDPEPIPPERVIHIAKQLCDALGAAHERGIVHRDMKPDNVFLVSRPNNPDFVKVLDFGIAKVGGANSKLTKAGQVFGTPHYMRPEPGSGAGVDHRTDISAGGVILYEMACGRVPFDADNLMGILTKHIYEQPIPPHDLPPPIDVPPGLEAVIMKALAKQADQRYQTMAEMRADLDALSAGQTPQAVLDPINRNTGNTRAATGPFQPMSPDQTGAQGLRVGVGGDAPAEGGSNLPVILGAVVGLFALVAAGLAVYFLVLAPDDSALVAESQPETDPEPEIEPEPDVTNETETEAETEVAAQPEAPVEQARVTVVSEPAAVEVWVVDEQAGETLAGNTPFEVPRPEAGEFVNLVLKQPGFEDHEIRIGQFTSDEVRVTMREPDRGRRGGRRRGGRGSQQQQQQQQQQETQPQPQETQQNSGRRGGIGSEVLDPWAR